MPAILTHHLFGIEVYDKLDQLIGANTHARNAFLLGNQGPDPLLCLKILPSAVGYKDIGTLMHAGHPTQLLETLHQHMVKGANGTDGPLLRAFALGFLCHYLLDSTAHPLIYAQQYAICKAGLPGIPPRRAGNIVHALIETELDEFVLDAKRGITVTEFQPHLETLQCEEPELWKISSRLGTVASAVYDLAVPPYAFVGGVHLYRTAQLSIDARRNYPTIIPDAAQWTGDSRLHIKAFIHSAVLKGQTPFANKDHAPWEHPFVPGTIVNASFDELYDQALEKSLESLPAFAQSDFSASACEALTGNVNFNGKPVTR